METIKDAPIGRAFARLLKVSEKETRNKNSGKPLIRLVKTFLIRYHLRSLKGIGVFMDRFDLLYQDDAR